MTTATLADVIAGAVAVQTGITVALAVRVVHWSDEFRRYAERLARLEERIRDERRRP